MESSGIADICLVVARGDTAELLDLLEEVLDQVAPFVDLLVVGDDPGPAGIGGDHRQGAALVQGGAKCVVVEGLVGDEGIEIEPCDQRLDPDAVVALAGQENEAGQVAQRIDQGDDLGGQPTARFADGLILSPPFAPQAWRWTLTMVPSMRAYSKSASCESS